MTEYTVNKYNADACIRFPPGTSFGESQPL